MHAQVDGILPNMTISPIDVYASYRQMAHTFDTDYWLSSLLSTGCSSTTWLLYSPFRQRHAAY